MLGNGVYKACKNYTPDAPYGLFTLHEQGEMAG